MINITDFTKRLRKVIDYYGLSASAFADKLGVQRSSISHILSGRNKPSLEFVMKILDAFPEVELYWLLNGKGNFPNIASEETQSVSKTSISKNESHVTQQSLPFTTAPISKKETAEKQIAKIIILYTDGTFEDFVK